MPATSPTCHVTNAVPLTPYRTPRAPRRHTCSCRVPPCNFAVRILVLRCQRWRAAALARLVRVALDLALHSASHAVHALFQMLRAAGRSVVNSVARAPPMAVRVSARLVGKRRRCLPVVALTPSALCQALCADLVTARGTRGGVGFKAPRAPTLPVRLPLAACACAACANPNLS